jgi:hypothetical protein
MKKITMFLALISIILTAHSQIKWKEYSQSFLSDSTNTPAGLTVMVLVPETNNAFWDDYSNKAYEISLSTDSLFRTSRPGKYIAISSFDTCKAQFFLHVGDKNSGDEYEYRVLENLKREVLPWTSINKHATKKALTELGINDMVYLGGYKTTFTNDITIDIRKKGRKEIITSAIVHWRVISPILLNIYTENELNTFLKRLNEYGGMNLTAEERAKWEQKYTSDQLDEFSGLPKKLVVAPTDNNLIFYLKINVINSDQLEYELVKNNKIIRPWGMNDLDNGFVWLKNLDNGDYLIKFRYTVQRQNEMEYPFLVQTAYYQTVFFKIAIVLFVIALWGLIIFLIILFKQRQRAAREYTKKVKLQLELKTIYAQLNPHFVFNALSSIQGLINKHDIEGANKYLSDFANLMRNSLNNSNKDQTTLKEEITTLDTYLKLEQLRFGFQYKINTNEINIYETEIPPLLLQPLIENAVKHGVASLKEKGLINIDFMKSNNDMMVKIEDNGAGFNYSKVLQGYGLKLTMERIKLLNQIHPLQSIELNITETLKVGALISITLKNWFL